MIKKISKKFWTKNNIFYLGGTLSLISLGMVGYSLQSTSALNNASWVRKHATFQNNVQNLPLNQTLKTSEEYNAYFKKISQNPNGEDVSKWFDNPQAPQTYPQITNGITLIQLFRNEKIANAVYSAIRSVNPNFRNSGVNSVVTANDLASVKELNLANENLTEVNYLLLNPNLQWTNLTSIDLDNNNFSNYQLIFNKNNMPKLWKISARNSQLKYMVDVSSYVTDPYDQTHDFLNGNPARSSDGEYNGRAAARVEYDTPLINNVPRYFDVANNEIRFIPKYYLKIALGYLDISNNQLGLGSASDPMGYYAIPSYSDDRAFIPSSTRALAIPDTDVKGPYGMNIYLTGDRKDGLFANGPMARWRAQPFPIRSLRFASYNAVPDNNGQMDVGINKNVSVKPTGASLSVQNNNVKLPFFNFSVNKLNNIPIFWDARSNYDPLSSTKPQTKNTSIYVGLEEWKNSEIYNDVKKQALYQRFKDISAFDTDASFNPFFDYSATDLNFDYTQQDRELYYRAIEVAPRSFNGYDMFMIGEDERDLPTSGANSVFTNIYPGISVWWTNIEALVKPRGYQHITEENIKKGVRWKPYKSSTNDQLIDSVDTNNLRFAVDEFWGVDYERNWGANITNNITQQILMGKNLFLRTYVNTNYSYLLRGDRDNSKNFNSFITPNSAEAHLFYDYPITRRTGIATFGNAGIVQRRGARANYYAEGVVGGRYYIPSHSTWKGYSFLSNTNNGLSVPVYHRKNSFITHLNGQNSFGVPESEQPPYYSQYNKLFGGLGGYNYLSNYIVLDNMTSKFKSAHEEEGILVKNISTPLIENGTTIQNKYTTNDNSNLVTQSITNLDLKNGEGIFWDNKTQFDTEYMKVIDPNDIELVFDDENGELTFKFRVYSPGYTTLGRLMRMDDDSDLDASKTLDFWVVNKVQGFTKIGLWNKTNPDTPTLISGKNRYDSNIEINIPEDLKNQTVVSIKAEQIAKLFETNYLGNKLTSNFNSDLVELEKTQGQKTQLEAEWINVTKYNPEEGEVEFKIDIPDYRFVNGNFMYFPKNLRDATFVLKGFEKLEISYVGDENKPFVSSSFTDQSKYEELIAKPASEITALDIFNANVIASNRPDWTSIQNDSAQASQIFTNLIPNNTVGTLSFLIRLPGDNDTSLSPFIRQVVWAGFLNKATQANWITQEQLAEKFPTLNPTQLKAKFAEDPLAFFNSFDNTYQGEKVTKENIFFQDNNFFINDDTGDFRVLNFSLNKFKRDGVDQTANISSNYLNLGASPNYKGTLPPSSIAWIEADAAKEILLNTFVERQLITNNNDVTPIVTIEERKNNLTPTEAKIFFLRSSSSFNFESLFSSLKNISIRNIKFKNDRLADSLTADNEKGTLEIHDISFEDWRNDDNSLSTHNFPEKLIINFSKITTSFAWSNLLPLDLRFQAPHIFDQTFLSKKAAGDFVAKLDMGVKFFDNDGGLLTQYDVDLDKVVLNTYSGSLKFETGAVQVNQQYNNGVKIANFSSPEKTYNLTITSSTRAVANQEIATTSSEDNKKAYLQFVNPGLKYNQLSEEEKEVYNAQYEALDPVDLNGMNVRDAIKTLKNWQSDNNKVTISIADLAKIDELKMKNSATSSIDFSNYSYVPEFMFYVTKPNLAANDPNRTYIIARTFEQSPIQENILIFRDVYIINDYQNRITSIRPLSQAVSFYNFNQTTFLDFNEDSANSGYKLLANDWKAMDAENAAAELQYLFQNRNSRINAIRNELANKRNKWRSMFIFGLVPNNGNDDPMIAYPSAITYDVYQRKVRIDQLLFPHYFVNETGKLPQRVNNITRNYGQNAVFKVDGGTENSHVASALDISSEKIVGKSIDQLLKEWNLEKGNQTDAANTYDILKNNNVLKINGDGLDLLNPNNSKAATAKIGKIDVDIQVDNNKGILKFSQIQIKDGWFNGSQNKNYKNVPDVDIEFELITTQVVPKRSLQGAILLVYNDLAIETFGSYNINNALLLWQKDLADTNNIEAQQRALRLIQEMNNLNGTVIENGVEKTYLAFKEFDDFSAKTFGMEASSITETVSDSDLNLLITPNSVEIRYTPVNIMITIKNLKIFNGYQESTEVEKIPIEKLVLTLSNDYSTNFSNEHGDQKINQLLKTNNLENGDVTKIESFFNKNSQLVLNSLFQGSLVDFGEQSDVPIITVNTNDLFGQVYITVHFKNFYVAGVDVGEKTFQYTFATSLNKLHIIIGSSVAAFAVFLTGTILFIVLKKRKKALYYLRKKKI